ANRAGLSLKDTVEFAASTSAGCAIATAALLDRSDEALALFVEMTARNPANIHWRNLPPWQPKPLLPHIHMYRQALEAFLRAEDLVALQHRRLAFLMAKSPRYLRGLAAALAAFSLYGLEKHLTSRVHPRWTRRLGFEPLVAGNQEASSPMDLIEIILNASCVPPVLPSMGYQGVAVLDGGMIDNVPAFLTDDQPGDTLVLLSKRYRGGVPAIPGRCYVQPSTNIALDKFDYANPEGLQATYALGYRDGEQFARDQRKH
ncbi:MAG: patatin-like phospholipase family protein, partial [Pseudomonadota bacterium]